MGAFVVACLNTQLFKNCPESSWNNGMYFIQFELNIRLNFYMMRNRLFAAGKGCAALREITMKCPIIAPIPSQD